MDAYREITQYTELKSIGITRGSVARIENARGMRLHVEHGAVWLTQDGSNDDVYLRAGESFTVENDGKTLISTLKSPLALVTMEPAPAQSTFGDRFWNWWASLYVDMAPRTYL
jgi:hypothetical protein